MPPLSVPNLLAQPNAAKVKAAAPRDRDSRGAGAFPDALSRARTGKRDDGDTTIETKPERPEATKQAKKEAKAAAAKRSERKRADDPAEQPEAGEAAESAADTDGAVADPAVDEVSAEDAAAEATSPDVDSEPQTDDSEDDPTATAGVGIMPAVMPQQQGDPEADDVPADAIDQVAVDPEGAHAVPTGAVAATENEPTEPAAAHDFDALVPVPADLATTGEASADDAEAAPSLFSTGRAPVMEADAQRNGSEDGAADQSRPNPQSAVAAVDQLAESTVWDELAAPADPSAAHTKGKSDVDSMTDLAAALRSGAPDAAQQPKADAAGAVKTAAAPELPREARFAELNHEKIVGSVRSELLPNGGTMRLQLDPPELGALQVTMHLRDGVMSAAFEASSDEAAKLLSHTLGQLKNALEAQGVSVDKLHVQQAPREAQTRGGDEQQQNRDHQNQQDASARQEQQRKEMVRRMWRRLAGIQDPLDVTG